jgi:hypothetical protein
MSEDYKARTIRGKIWTSSLWVRWARFARSRSAPLRARAEDRIAKYNNEPEPRTSLAAVRHAWAALVLATRATIWTKLAFLPK